MHSHCLFAMNMYPCPSFAFVFLFVFSNSSLIFQFVVHYFICHFLSLFSFFFLSYFSFFSSSLDLACIKVGVAYPDFKHCISQYIFSTWQDDWNGAVMNKLHSVKSVLGDWQSSYRRCRKDEVVLCHARIGHTHLTHSYIS